MITFTRTEALTLALSFAVLAPTESNAQNATALAEELAQGLDKNEVAQAKRNAQKMIRKALRKRANPC